MQEKMVEVGIVVAGSVALALAIMSMTGLDEVEDDSEG
jgi:hypothetical protein